MISPVTLRELIASVRRELEEAGRELRESNRAPLLDLEEVELELQFTLANDTKVDSKLDLKIFAIGSDDTVQDSQVQKVRLKYKVAKTARQQNLPGSRAHGSSGPTPQEDVTPLPIPE